MSEKEREAANSVPPTDPPCPPLAPPYSSVMAPPSYPQTNQESFLQDTPYWKVMTSVPTANTDSTGIPQGGSIPPPKPKSLLEAYLLGVPLGFLGAPHFYLGRVDVGIMYLFSFGLFGIGWLIDLLRMPCLVAQVNKANKEKYEQLQWLQQQRSLQMQQNGQAGAAAPPQQNVVFVAFQPRSLVDAYILWFPCGLLGYHHFYLRNWGMGILYHLTFGLLGIGWLVDLFLMPSLVREANGPAIPKEAKRYSQCTANVLAVSPAGILGGHHFYLNRSFWGVLYCGTFGLLGVGWIYDWFRTFYLVKRANAIQQGVTSPGRKYLDDAYVLCIPFGFTGLHHFYLHRYGWGLLYLCTFGIMGIGWLIDWFRLPCLVKEYNANMEFCQRLIFAESGNGGLRNAGMANQPQVITTSPVYPLAAGYGYYQATYPDVGHLGGPQDHINRGYMGQGEGEGQTGAGLPPPPKYSESAAPGSTPS